MAGHTSPPETSRLGREQGMRLGKRRPAGRFAVLVFGALLALLSVGVASAQSAQPGGITKEAEEMHTLYIFILVLAAIVFVLVEGLLIFAIIRYRKRSDALPKQTHGSTIIEMIWTGIPVAIVLTIFTYSFIVLRNVEHKEDPANMSVTVTGFQYQWQFDYALNKLGPGSDPADTRTVTIIGKQAEEPTLVIPVNEPVEFKLVSHDVIHSFYVRDFLYKLDVIPGRDNRFTMTAKQTGTFIGQCAELCGLNHALMRFHVQVMERADFDKWVADQAGGAKAAAQLQN